VPKTTPYKHVVFDPDNMEIILVMPVNPDMPLSKSGKTHILYTSRYPIDTGIVIAGEKLQIIATAFIKRINIEEVF
jgi:hypothetical protein